MLMKDVKFEKIESYEILFRSICILVNQLHRHKQVG